MADMPYPYYRLQATGSAETGFTLLFQLEEWPGGPLDGMTSQGVLDHLKQYFSDGGAVTVSLSYSEVTNTNV
ncbi:hypothetical protein [Streptomyces murinus]|uniref:hypothetical protein n=1 Tax=Streptomyces murinus TaxID=33900 RepID=UPI0038290481